MAGATLRVAMVAGEASGDLLGSRVIAALRRARPECRFELTGVGGPAMEAAGLHSLYPMERLAVMGLVEPLKRLPELLRLRRQLRQRFTATPPDFFLGIDAPDFNLTLARQLKRAGVPTAQLVSPTVWAWRAGRVHTVARAVDRLLCLFPFEPPLYRDAPVEALFVGHPLVRELSAVPDRAAARAALGIEGDGPVIALLPGSRQTEVAQLAPTLLRAGALLKGRDPARRLLLPAAGPERHAQCRQLIGEHAPDAGVQLFAGRSREVMLAADLVLLASGTAALEAMLLKRPMVITYRVAPLSWVLLRRLAVTRFVGLPNIFAGEAVVPELLQDDLTPPALALAGETLLGDGWRQVEALAPFRAALERDFDQAVADALLPLCRHA
jgi:lipid-A-disaccharide synthase